MKYIYVVTSLVQNPAFGLPIPVLGVHTSFKKADRHFLSVVDNRENYGSKVFWCKEFHDVMHLPGNDERVCVVKEAYTERNGERESIRLEKWRAI